MFDIYVVTFIFLFGALCSKKSWYMEKIIIIMTSLPLLISPSYMNFIFIVAINSLLCFALFR